MKACQPLDSDSPMFKLSQRVWPSVKRLKLVDVSLDAFHVYLTREWFPKNATHKHLGQSDQQRTNYENANTHNECGVTDHGALFDNHGVLSSLPPTFEIKMHLRCVPMGREMATQKTHDTMSKVCGCRLVRSSCSPISIE